MLPDIVYQEASPHGNADAVVEDDGTAIYLHLQFREEVEGQVRSVWVRNRGRAPELIDQGLWGGPLCPMPASRCRHPRGASPLVADALRLEWLPEGDGVGLYERGTMLAAIMPWSGIDGFSGYAIDAIGEGPLAWELSMDNLVHGRFREASAFWNTWAKEDGACQAVQAALLRCYESYLGPYSRYYTVDEAWPPRGIVCIPWRDRLVLLTTGISIRPQPTLELQFDDPRPYRRIELGVILPDSAGAAMIQRAISTLCGLSSFSWRYLTWLGHGHTLACDMTGMREHQGVIFAESSRWGPALELPRHDEDSVRLLWAVPASAEQLQLVNHRGADSVLASVGAHVY